MEGNPGVIFSIVTCSIIMLVGIPGNCLIIRVFWVKKRKTSTRILILSLAWVDLVSCFLLAYRIVHFTMSLTGGTTPPALGILDFLLVTAVSTSVSVTAVIAFDRYDSVCRLNRRLLSPKRAKIAFFCTAVYSVILTIPYLAYLCGANVETLTILAFQILCYIVALTMIVICYSKVYLTVRNHVRVGTWSTINSTDKLRPGRTRQRSQMEGGAAPVTASGTERLKVVSISESRLMKQGDSSVDMELTEAISAAVAPREQRPKGPSPTRSNTDRELPVRLRGAAPVASVQSKTTRMLLLTSIVFLVLWLPYWIHVTLQYAHRLKAWYVSPGLLGFFNSVNTVLYINSAINPFLYGLANQRFRRDCKDELRKIL